MEQYYRFTLTRRQVMHLQTFYPDKVAAGTEGKLPARTLKRNKKVVN